jgi:ParB/RepB/Spo0J family partition protein
MSTELKSIPLVHIRENPNALREVNRSTENYQGLVDSIQKNGVLNAILVRECVDPNTKATFYGLIDGLHRFNAAKDAGLTEIPAQVRSMDDADVLEAQVLANVHRIETKPVEYSTQLVRILIANPTLTMTELATRLSKSPTWLSERLKLVKLSKKIAELVDEGKVNLSNAYALAKLPEDEQANYVDRAMTEQPQQFVPAVTARVKELKDASRQGREAKPSEWVANPFLRKIGEVKDELNTQIAGKTMLAQFNVTDPLEAWKLAVQWVTNMDPVSQQRLKAEDEARKKELAAQKEKQKQERLAQKQKEAAEKAASIATL